MNEKVEQPPELDAEDDAILDGIWDRIGAERRKMFPPWPDGPDRDDRPRRPDGPPTPYIPPSRR